MNDENSVSEELSASAEKPAEELSALKAERDQLLQEKAELQDRLLRRIAEFENYRKRIDREMREAREYASADAVRALLPVLDDFQRALSVETSDTNFARGVELIYQRFFDQLKKLGLEPLEAHGKPFDPNLHEAIEVVPTSEAEDQTVLADLQRGYHFKGRLLRPAMVRVASNPAPAETRSSE